MNYQEVQNIARQTMYYISQTIKPKMNLKQIRQLCETKMLELGADSFWHWDVGAFCFAGEEAAIPVSGFKKENIYYFKGGELLEL